MNLSEINWDLDSAGTWPPLIKGVVTLILCLLVVGAWIHLDTTDQLKKLEAAEKKEQELRLDFEKKQKKAVNLEAYREQLKEMEETFGTMLKQLPNRTEVANLLVDVSQTGLATGLEFELFKPRGEVKKEFYAELPIDVRVIGRYPEFGSFVSGLAALSRIVTIHDVKIGPRGKDGTELAMDAVVKTYRYLDADEQSAAKEQEEAGKKKRRRRR